MVHHILIAGTDTLIVRSMVRSVHSHPPNLGYEEQLQHELKESLARKEDEQESPLIFTSNKVNNEQSLPGHPIIKRRGQIGIIPAEKLIDLYVYCSYTNRRGNQTAMKGEIRKQLEDNKFQVTFENGKHKTYKYEDLINKLNKSDEEGIELWEF